MISFKNMFEETQLEEGFFSSIGALAKVMYKTADLVNTLKKDLEKLKGDEEAISKRVDKYVNDLTSVVNKSSMTQSMKDNFGQGLINGAIEEIETLLASKK